MPTQYWKKIVLQSNTIAIKALKELYNRTRQSSGTQALMCHQT